MSAIPPPAVDTGYRLKNGSPAIKVKVWGIFQEAAKELEAIIDTGFTGFLSLHIVEALPLGLVLASTTKVTFADGSTGTNLLAWGTIGLPSGQVAAGLVLLESNPSPTLLGMAFLNQFERTLLIFGEKAIPPPYDATAEPVLLVDNKAVHEVLAALFAAAAQARAAPAAPPPAVAPDTPAAPGVNPAAPSP